GHFPYVTLERTGWEAIDCSAERADDGGGKAAVLDGNLSTYWHSQWGQEAPLPHWILIDMKKVYEIGVVEIVRRLD
ncbi:discoidin domain-containing protein, partial [Bacteroides thetaiotaomicron]|uniref:discoidin domain-containing protein n=1 Tax=Bacteroides thetaiotaomicron TaxID=818 RepID=UPI002109BF84